MAVWLFFDPRSVAGFPVVPTELRWWGYQAMVQCVMHILVTLVEHPCTHQATRDANQVVVV